MFPTTLRHILVPTDFSDLSDQALDAAVALARPVGARLALVHVFQLPFLASEPGFDEVELVTMLERHASEHLARRAARAEHHHIRCETFARAGTPHMEIVRLIEHRKPDLVVMSTHGRTGLTHAVLGSVTERVLRHAGCPVLVLPAQPA